MPEKPPVIIAEDNPRDREFLGSALPGYTITFATNGREALEAALAHHEPWVISDLQMPEMDGIQLAKSLWAQRPSARIVFWSQHKDEIYVRALADIIPPETVYGYVLKSSPSEVLSRAVETSRHVPVLVLTRVVDSDCCIEALNAGAYEYVQKPLTTAEVRELVSDYLKPPAEEIPTGNDYAYHHEFAEAGAGPDRESWRKAS